MPTADQLKVANLGERRFPSPLALSATAGDDLTDFTPDEARLLVRADFSHGQEVDLSLGEIAEGVLEGDPIAILDLGILLLIATPLSRVVTAAAVFLVEREGRYALLSLLVLGMVFLAVLTG